MTWDQEITNESLSQNEGRNIQTRGVKGLYVCPGKLQLCVCLHRIKALDLKHPWVQADATKDHSGFLYQARIHDSEAAALPSQRPRIQTPSICKHVQAISLFLNTEWF